MKSEAKIQRDIIRKLESLPKTWVLNTVSNGMQEQDIPDLIICHYGKFIGLEIKRPKLGAETGQAYKLYKISKAGGEVAVVSSVEEALLICRKARRRFGPAPTTAFSPKDIVDL